MIGAEEFIKCECEHLIHSTSPDTPRRGAGKDHTDPQAPQSTGLREHLIHKGGREAEACTQARDTGTGGAGSHAKSREP